MWGGVSVVHTVGHSTRSVDGLVALLREAGVGLLLDVRSFPRSRRNPQFNVETLPDDLKAVGIGYRHVKALGGRRSRQPGADNSPNTAWRVEVFRNYADYALTPPFREALGDLIALSDDHACGVMCAEAVWWQCHRRIITDHLIAADVEVRHILEAGQIEPAALGEDAVVQPDRSVHYPAAQTELF